MENPKGNSCRRCGWFHEPDSPHSYCIGPQAGHYCFGCEPQGVMCTRVNDESDDRPVDDKDS